MNSYMTLKKAYIDLELYFLTMSIQYGNDRLRHYDTCKWLDGIAAGMTPAESAEMRRLSKVRAEATSQASEAEIDRVIAEQLDNIVPINRRKSA